MPESLVLPSLRDHAGEAIARHRFLIALAGPSREAEESMPVKSSKHRILLIKGHSSGIGDLLRSSAAWRALLNEFADAELHLLLLTRHPEYVSHDWIARHHLFKRFCVIDKRAKG